MDRKYLVFVLVVAGACRLGEGGAERAPQMRAVAAQQKKEPSEQSPPSAAPQARPSMDGHASRITERRWLYGDSLEDLALLWRSSAGYRNGSHPVVVHLGDSHSAMGWFPQALRRTLGTSPAPGLVNVGHPARWDVKVTPSAGWKVHNWLRSKATGPFGPLGVAVETFRPGEVITISRIARTLPTPLRLSVLVAPGSTNSFILRADGRRVRPSMTVSRPSYREVIYELSTAFSRLTLTTRRYGRLRIFGFWFRSPGCDVEWNVLAVGGTTIYQTLRRRDPSFGDFLEEAQPDLVVIWFGTNILWDRARIRRSYERDFDEYLSLVLDHARGARCLVISPPDLVDRDPSCFLLPSERRALESRRLSRRARRRILRAHRRERVCDPDALITRQNGTVVYPGDATGEEQWRAYKERCAYHTVEALGELIEIQKRVALRHGCAYFDAHAFLGGDAAIVRMACEEPAGAYLDLVHLTRLGYTRLAEGVVEAIRGVR